MRFFKPVLLAFMLLATFALAPFNTIGAQSDEVTPCNSASYSALIQLPAGSYNTYVQAGRAEDNGNIKIYFQPFDSSDCVFIGQGGINDTSWKNLGTYNFANQTNSGVLSIATEKEYEDTQAGASSPQVVFSDSKAEPCNLEVDCSVEYQGQNFELSPRKISMAVDSIRVGLLTPYSTVVKEVLYTVDSRVAYSKPTLEEFNENYVPDGEHSLGRIIVLKDGQSLSDSRTLKRGLDGGFSYFFVSVLYRQSNLIKFATVVILLLVLFDIGLYIQKRIRRRKLWKREHFATIEQVDMSKAGFQQNFSLEESDKDLLFHHKKLIITFFAVAASLVFINSFVISYFTVDGVSMFPTLQDRSKRPLLILPTSIGRLNRNFYTPTRGTVVVIQKDDNNLFVPEAEQVEHYVVKRVVGLPGERVVIKDSVITIFNKRFEKGFVPDDEFKWVKDLTGSEGIALDITLKDGEIFVVGDNRDESIDSRFYGPVKTSLVVGKVY